MNCESVRKELSLFLYGELSFEDEEALHHHLDGCEDCRRALEREKVLHEALDRCELAPPPDLLPQCRRGLRLRIDQAAEQAGWLRRFLGAFQRPVVVGVFRPAGALALIAAGFVAARFTLPTNTTGGPAEASLAGAGPMTTQVRYLRPDPSGKLRIVIDETRQRVLSGSLEDENIRQLLLAAVRESSNPGVRVESMDILRTRSDSTEVREALLHALQYDPNPGVRLKALEGLKSFGSEPEVRRALTHVLRSDENPGVRTQAIDLLVQHKEAGMAGVLQELLHKEDNNYVRLRCQKALRDMNASVETF